MFELKKDGSGNTYVEVAGVLTPNDWKDVRVALIPEGNDERKRPCIRLYNWSSGKGIGQGNVDIPLDAVPALKQAIGYLLIKSENAF